MASLRAQPTDRKVFQIMMAVLFAFGLIKCFTGIFGIIFGIIVMLLAIFGIWGSFFNHKKALFMFLMGMIVLLLLEIGYFVYEYLTFTSTDAEGSDKSYALFGMILSVIMLAFYFGCAFVGFRLWKA